MTSFILTTDYELRNLPTQQTIAPVLSIPGLLADVQDAA
jgi:hypothetical protein